MTTNATTAEDRLAELGIHLPDAPTPFGAYVPAVQTGNLLSLAKPAGVPTIKPGANTSLGGFNLRRFFA